MTDEQRRLAHVFALPAGPVHLIDDGRAEAACAGLLRALAASGRTITRGPFPAPDAAIVLAPHGARSPEPGRVLLEYATPAETLAGANLAQPIPPDAAARKAAAMAEYPSQMTRLAYDEAAEASASANAAALRMAGICLPEGSRGAEVFRETRLRAGVEAAKPGIRLNDGAAGAAVFLAPHYDDVEISSGAALQADLAAGCGVTVLYMVTGYRAEVPGAESIAERTELREAESRAAGRALGLTEPVRCLRLGFYDRIVDVEAMEPGSDEGHPAYRIGGLAARNAPDPDYGFGGRFRAVPGDSETVWHIAGRRWVTEEDIDRVRAEVMPSLRGAASRVIYLPDASDKHPDHLATRFIGWKLARELSTAEPAAPVIVRAYRAPWAGRYNSWWPADGAEGTAVADPGLAAWRAGTIAAHGLTAPELAARAGFGATPDLGFRAAEPFRCTPGRPLETPSILVL